MSAAYRIKQGETIDLIAWRHYGDVRGAVETVLEANTHLAAQGAHPPLGSLILLPDLPSPAAESVVRLWG